MTSPMMTAETAVPTISERREGLKLEVSLYEAQLELVQETAQGTGYNPPPGGDVYIAYLEETIKRLSGEFEDLEGETSASKMGICCLS